MPRFWTARLELVTQKKRKEEQAKRENEKQNRLKKKNKLKSSSSSGGEEESKSELSKQQENIFARRQNYAHHSSSSEGEVPTSPGLALSYEMRKNDLFKSQERLDEKRSPPPVLPKPKPKPKPKLPPTNKNPASPTVQPINSHAMQEIANEISQIKLNNNKKNKLVKMSSSDSDSVDGNVFTKNEVKTPPKIPKKPLQHTKSLDIVFNEVQETQNIKSPPSHNSVKPRKCKSAEENIQSINEDTKASGLSRQNAGYSEETKDSKRYAKMENPPDSTEREETSSTPREILLNLKERGANLMMNKKRVLSNMCWGCPQNGGSLDDEDPLYSSVNFATLGHKNGTIKDTSQLNTPECTPKSYPNPTYFPPTPISPPKEKSSNVVQISTDLGIKEVQNIVQGGTSYTVGDNRDLYSLPVKGRRSSDNDVTEVPSSPEKSSPGKRIPEINLSDKNIPTGMTPDDTYSRPLVDSPRKLSNNDSDKYDIPEGGEGPYAQTALFETTPAGPTSQYDIPGILIDTASTTFDLKPPNFKPPPPPPGSSPILRRKNKNKHSPPVVRNKNKEKSPKKKSLLKIASEASPKNENFAFSMKRSQSESDLTSEPIFATPSSIGIHNEDNNNNNNNRHSMFVTPKEVGKFREFFVYSDEVKAAQEVNHHNHIGNHRDHIGNYEEFPAIVPPPPSSTPIIDTDSMVAPPPPHMTSNTHEVHPPPPIYPPPRLHPSERALVNVNTHSEESQWQEMIDSLPPPPPDLLES